MCKECGGFCNNDIDSSSSSEKVSVYNVVSSECCLNNKFTSGQCCCNCKWLLKDYSHPITDGKSILKQRGWICQAPELDGMFSGWSEHGMCEMHSKR